MPRATAQRLEWRSARAELVDHAVSRQHHRNRPRDRQHAERCDEGGKAKIGNDNAVDEPNGPSCEQADNHRGPGRIAGLENQAARDGGQTHDRADREVDAACRDHRSHAERHDPDEGEIARGVVEIIRGGERRRLQPAHHDANDEKRDRHPERLRTREALPEIVLLDVQHRFDRYVGLRRVACHRKAPQAAWIAPVIKPVTSSGLVAVIALSATLLPRRITMTRSQTAKTSGMRWLMRMIAMPESFRRRIRSRTSATCLTEIAAVGSSISTMRALERRVRAIATACL